MTFLKNLALSLLSFLLFLALSILGLAFVLNNTLLTPDFVTSELERLDIASLAGDFISVQTPGQESSEEMTAALVNTISELEPMVKEQASAAIDSIYDYLLGKSQSLDLALTLKNTILSSDFVVALVDKLDISSLAGEYLREQLIGNIPADAGYLVENIDEHLDDVITDLKPWLKEQIAASADPMVDYLLGESRSLSITISLEPVKENLRDRLWAALQEAPPPELAAIPRARWKPYFDQLYQEFSQEIPATFELDESLIGTEIPSQVTEAIAEAEWRLAQAKQYIGYFQLGYRALIGFMVLLILGIILISREVKDITRRLGTTFLSYGALQYVGILVNRYFSGGQLPLPGQIPASLITWITQFLDNLLAPLETLSLGLIIGGVALIVVSFVYKPRQSEQ